MADRLGFIEHKGKRILRIDLTGCELEETVVVVREGKKLIAAEPIGSLLTLTIVTGARANSASERVMKEFTAHNKPYVRAGAVVGLDRIRQAVFLAVIKFSGRNLGVFRNAEEAKEWLVAQ